MSVLQDLILEHHLGINTPGFAMLAMAGDDVIASNYVGVGDRHGTPISKSSNFRLASVSKQFTAACILQLVDDKDLTLDTDLCAIFPDFPVYGRAIRIRH